MSCEGVSDLQGGGGDNAPVLCIRPLLEHLKGSEIAKYATAYNQQVHRQAKERLERGLEVLQEQGKYLDLDADTVLADLRKIADGNLSSSAELDPRVVQFLNAEFSPAGLRDTLFEPEGWEQYAALAIDLLFPLPSAKTAAVRRIADKISGEALEALEAKFGADLLAGGAKGASSTASSSEAIWSSTKSKSAVENALGHWNKHKSEFPEIQNAKQYAEKAKSFLTNPPQGTLTKTNARGDTLRYDPGTNTFGVLGQDGAPRTMFRPTDGINYWNRQ